MGAGFAGGVASGRGARGAGAAGVVVAATTGASVPRPGPAAVGRTRAGRCRTALYRPRIASMPRPASTSRAMTGVPSGDCASDVPPPRLAATITGRCREFRCTDGATGRPATNLAGWVRGRGRALARAANCVERTWAPLRSTRVCGADGRAVTGIAPDVPLQRPLSCAIWRLARALRSRATTDASGRCSDRPTAATDCQWPAPEPAATTRIRCDDGARAGRHALIWVTAR